MSFVLKNLVCLGVCSVLFGAAASAQNNLNACSTAAIAGNYSVACSGWTTGPGGGLVPFKQVGIATGYPNGIWTGFTTVNVAGQTIIPRAPVTGQAVVNLDCTGSITYNRGTSTEVNISFVVNPKTDEILGLTTDRGSVISCELKRMSDNRTPKTYMRPDLVQ